jgi:hypothetical protein
LTSLKGNIHYYIQDIAVDCRDWIRKLSAESEKMKLSLIEEVITEICNDHLLRLKHYETSLDSFWIPMKGGRERDDLMQSSTSYLCK